LQSQGQGANSSAEADQHQQEGEELRSSRNRTTGQRFSAEEQLNGQAVAVQTICKVKARAPTAALKPISTSRNVKNCAANDRQQNNMSLTSKNYVEVL
jgi:hypothetical protein